MDEGADLKNDPSPARICLELLGNQLDELERRQADWDGRQNRWQSENARVLTKLVKRLEDLSSFVSESTGPPPELQALQLELEQLVASQSETKSLVRSLERTQLKSADPAIADLRRRLDQALEALDKTGADLEVLKQLPLQPVQEMRPTAAEYKILLQEMSRVQRDQAEAKTLLRSLQQAKLSPDDPMLLDLRQRLDQALEALQQTGTELESLRQIPLRAAGDSSSSAIEHKALQLELARIQSDQAETKALVRGLQLGKLNPDDPALLELRHRLDQALDALHRTGSELESLRQMPREGAERSTDQGDAVQAELARLNREQAESKRLLLELQQATLNPDDPALLELRHRLDQALDALHRTGSELESLRQLPHEGAERSSDRGDAVQAELARLNHEQAESKRLLLELQHATLNPDDPALLELRHRLDQALEALHRTGSELESLRQLPRERAERPTDQGDVVQAELARLTHEQAESKRLLLELQQTTQNPDHPALLELRHRLDQALEALHRTGSELESLRTTPREEAETSTDRDDAVQAELARLNHEQAESKRLLLELQQATQNPDNPALLELRHRLDQALEALQHTGRELEILKQLPLQAHADSGDGAESADALHLELARLRQEHAESKQLLAGLRESKLNPDDPALQDIRIRLDKALEMLVQTGSELESLRQLSPPARENSDEEPADKATIELLAAQKLLQRELAQVHDEQADIKLLLGELKRGQPDVDDPRIGDLSQRLEQGFELLQRSVSDLSEQGTAGRNSELSEGQLQPEITSALMESQELLRSDLGIVQLEQAELKELLKSLVDNQAKSAVAPHEDINSRLDVALAELRSARADIQTLKERPATQSSNEGGANAERLNTDLLAAYEDLAEQLANLKRERDDLQLRLASPPELGPDASDEALQLRSQLDAAQEELHRAQLEAESLRSMAAAGGGGGNEALIVEFSRVEQERDELRTKIKLLQERTPIEGSDDELQDRLHEALDDLRRANKEIERIKNQPAPKASIVIPSGGNWEAQKQALLAALESEDTEDESRGEEVLSMEQLIRATDKAIGSKDQEIAELQQLLAQQSENIGGVAVGAAAIEEILNHDELIQQERDSLNKMKAEWREKLSKAEIEISMERAKLAREKKELEAKIDQLEQAEKKKASAANETEPVDPSQKNRWFARLGLEEK